MPKQRITKEMVVAAAFEIAKDSGMEHVLVKNIADKIGCSVQPIYSYCKNMDSLRQEVARQSRIYIQEYISARIDKDDLFRSTGRLYVQLAKEEPHLFKIFILHQRTQVSSLADLYQAEAGPQTAAFIARQLNITEKQAQQLHLHMLIYTIGIGTIFSMTEPGISADEIYAQQETAYEAFLNYTLNCKKS